MKKILILLFLFLSFKLNAQLPCGTETTGNIITGIKSINSNSAELHYTLRNYQYVPAVIPPLQVIQFEELKFSTQNSNLKVLDFFVIFQQFLNELLKDNTVFVPGVYQIQFPSCIKFDNFTPISTNSSFYYFRWCTESECCIRKYSITNDGPCGSRKIIELNKQDNECPGANAGQQFSNINEIENFLLQPLNVYVTNENPNLNTTSICMNFCELLSFLETNKLFVK